MKEEKENVPKEKRKFIPFNLIWCFSSFIIPFIVLTNLFNFPNWPSAFLSLYLYIQDIYTEGQINYLEEKIGKLEEKTKNQPQ